MLQKVLKIYSLTLTVSFKIGNDVVEFKVAKIGIRTRQTHHTHTYTQTVNSENDVIMTSLQWKPLTVMPL